MQHRFKQQRNVKSMTCCIGDEDVGERKVVKHTKSLYSCEMFMFFCDRDILFFTAFFCVYISLYFGAPAVHMTEYRSE